jgi:hypothetical protein
MLSKELSLLVGNIRDDKNLAWILCPFFITPNNNTIRKKYRFDQIVSRCSSRLNSCIFRYIMYNETCQQRTSMGNL